MAKIGSAIAPCSQLMAQRKMSHDDDELPMKWEEDCVAISRQKARHRARAGWKRRVMLIAMVMIPTYVGLGGWWVWTQNSAQVFSKSVTNWVLGITADAGFKVQHIEVAGLKNLRPEWVLDAANIRIGDPIFSVSVAALWKNIQALPEVRSVQIERDLPDTLRLVVTEREAVARWQYQGRQQWMDRDGTLLANQQHAATDGDMVLVGKDVPAHAERFLKLMETTPALKEKIVSAVRVGNRRWDVAFDNGLVVKLPASNMAAAWKKFAALVENEKLMDRDINMVDLRIEGRVFLTLNPQPDALKMMPLTLTSESPQ